ncbi:MULTISPECIES: nucleoside hydrolase [Xanthomonas]|uniref:Nucleoside hydrolase n=1 Tax=Xanthomonas rydalmerensis TaxID=3046274 RepID=A0ABZ0JJ81_9XANT|nr:MULTISPECIES: nucleoside hydrolase [unclassified Xanthomonas]WOS39864.1 nucleoside hydrolase [Xanthomonas sp. DM-2023]WOS44048.1 nucleoside hydrolase [Xanthomonas sp. DM-2023]WOS48228.1 nucleoside hydrolase [Xanthomonas sp. DM-2023]WOS52407.1 nucleoside hydrolase [Xanthomonas sp. DM-2023]WOS56591.1 nucleoside hydrolase [Xanthomonas sp. DM-2023]
MRNLIRWGALALLATASAAAAGAVRPAAVAPPQDAGASATPVQKVIVSTDIGDDIDDAFALALLLRSPELQVLGIASAWGDTGLRAQLLQRLLQQAGRSDIPLAIGQRTTSSIPFSQARWAAKGRLPAAAPDAAAFILAQARRHPGEVTLLVLGPLTDAARAQQRDPAGFAQLKQVVLMGGSVRVGYGKSRYRPPNPPAAEYNIAADIAAAQRVFAAGVPIVMLPLDATQVTLEEPERVALFAHGEPLTDALAQLYYQWRDTDQPWASATPTLFDVVPVAQLLDPSLCPTVPLRIVVDDKGYTREAPAAGAPGAAANAQVCLALDRPRLIALYMQRLLR